MPLWPAVLLTRMFVSNSNVHYSSEEVTIIVVHVLYSRSLHRTATNNVDLCEFHEADPPNSYDKKQQAILHRKALCHKHAVAAKKLESVTINLLPSRRSSSDQGKPEYVPHALHSLLLQPALQCGSISTSFSSSPC